MKCSYILPLLLGVSVNASGYVSFKDRRVDWRFGPTVYQVIVDRFNPAENLQSKLDLYSAPKKIRLWEELPVKGHYLPEVDVWSHEIDFWGGDLKSLKAKLDYINSLDVDVLYLNPIFNAYTNHKYDTIDYYKISPEYGDKKDLNDLVEDLHQRKMKIILDGVFNHTSRKNRLFTEHKDKFYRTDDLGKVIGWYDVFNLPELNYDNRSVERYIYGSKSSVFQSYLRNEKIDGWRLDVAFELGRNRLQKMKEISHSVNPQSVLIGEVWSHPNYWKSALDGLLNMYGREIIIQTLNQHLEPSIAVTLWEDMVDSAGIDYILRSWIVFDNHDTKRLATEFTNFEDEMLLRSMQFTLPGSPVIYYGSEIGMVGGDDPQQRAPMRWDLVNENNQHLKHIKKLTKLRKDHIALRIGDFKKIQSSQSFSFSRFTDKVDDFIMVAANFKNKAISEVLSIGDGKIMDDTVFVDLLSGKKWKSKAGLISLNIDAKQILILRPEISRDPNKYSSYKNIK